jgi:hypothetical protein
VRKEELAELLDGREYREEITSDEELVAKHSGLVVIFGASDDLMEFRGAIYDECGACDGSKALIDQHGLLPNRQDIEDDDVLENFFHRRKTARKIEALWCKEDEYSWTFKTDIPHATFEVLESIDGETTHYCRGIVIDMKDLKLD